MSWKKEGGKRVNSIIDSTKDITNKYYSTDPTISKNDKEGVYFYKEGGSSVVGFGTKTPYSRLSFGDYNVNNLDSNGYVKGEEIANNASIALSEKADGSNATGISFFREGTNSAETRGIRFTINNNKTGTVQQTSLEKPEKENTSLMLLNDGTSQKVLINSLTSQFSNTGTGLEVNGDIHLTKNLVFDINQTSGDVIKKAGTLFYDGRDDRMKWITGPGADIRTIAGVNDTAFAINTTEYDASFAVIKNNDAGFLAFKDLGLCIGNGEMLTDTYLSKFSNNTKQHLPALSILGHHQNGVASNANVLISDISNVTGEAILSKTSPIDLSANGVIYLLNNLTIDKYEPEAVIDVSKINVPFLSMGTDITNYYNSVVIGEDISGSSNSFYFGKNIYNNSSYDSSFNFIFGENITISKSNNFENNLIFGSNLDVSGNNNLVFGQNLTIGPDVSFCMLLGNGTGTAQKGDLIKYFENGTSVFNLKSGGNLILGGDISANDASFNNVVFNNLGNETSKIKLAFVKGLSAENISIENSLTIGGKFNSTSDISANDASFNNIDINNLKSYGNFIVNGNMDTIGYANFGGHANFGSDISANDASFNNIDINNLKTYGNAVINGNIDTTGHANFGGDISANDASFNSININVGDINELKNVQKINFDSTLLIQKSNSNIVTINQNGMLIGGELDAISLKIDGKVFDTTASSSWASGNSKNYTGTNNGLYIPIKVGVNFDAPSANKLSFFPKFPLDVSGVIRSQNQVFGHLSIDLVPQPLSGYTNTITNKFYGSGIYDVSENVLNASPVWKLFDGDDNTFWQSTGSEDTVTGISGGDVSITGKYLEIKLPERCTLKHYAFKSSVAAKLPKMWTIIGKIGVDDEVSAVNNTWKVIDYKTESVQYGADGKFVYFTVDNLKYSNDMYKVFRIYITETFNGSTVGTADVSQCQISELKLFGEPGNITDISSSLIQTELFDISGALFKQKHLSLQPLGGNVGIRNNNPSVILDISSNNAIRLPMGNTNARPSSVDASGCLRYNTDTKQFEGYGDAGWAGLGGVIDKNQDTYIAAEENTNEDMLRFYTAGVERMVINANGVVDVSGLLQSKEISGNSVNATMLRTDGLIINNKTIVSNSITDNNGFRVNSKVGYFDVSYDGNYYINNILKHAIYAYPGSILQFNLDVVGHPFNIFKGRDDSVTGTIPNGLQHVDENGTITTVSSVHNKTSGTLMWFIPYDVIGEYRYQCSVHTNMNGNINILPRPSDISANDISGGHIFANSLRSNGMVINGNIGIHTLNPLVSLDISGTDAIRIPVGNDTLIGSGGQKPSGADGMIRYNNVSKQFEGYGDARWAGLGGVIDKNQDTYITAEKNTNEDKLRFYTKNVERMIITDSDNSGNIGINTSNPSVTLDISSNNAIRLPMGNTNARPADASGCLRYNTETKQFEGYGEGSWSGLGGVISLNMETKITAEDAGGLTFFTNGQKRMNIADSGNIDISSAVTINNNLDLSGNLDCSSAVIEILTSDSTYVKDLSCSDLDISGILKTDGLIINNKTIALNNITNSNGFYVNSKVGYFDISSVTGGYFIDGFSNNTIYAYPGSILQFNLDNVTIHHPFNIFKGGTAGTSGIDVSGLQHVADNGIIRKDAAAQNATSGTLIWHVPFNSVGLYRYQCSSHVNMKGHINILPIPSDVSANDISGGHVFASSLISNGVVINGDISGNTATFANSIMNTLAISDNLDCSNAFIENLDCSNVFITDLSANDISGGHVFASSLISNGIVINGDISGNTATFANGIMNTVAISDNLDCSNAFIENLDCSNVFITDLSANDISGGHVFASSLISNGIVINGDISGNTATFANGIMNTVAISDNLDCSNAFIENLDCSNVFITDLSANDISGGHVFASSLISNGVVINGDISGNTATFANGIMNTVAISDNLDCSNAFIENLDCSNVFITDLSANDISGGHVFASSLISNGVVINGDISGNTATFANGIMNTVAISDNLDCSNAFIENLDCSNVFITDLSANDISGGHVFASTLTIAGDLSGNNARLYDVSVNRLWIGDVEMIGHIPGNISGAPTNTGTLTGNMVFNGDLSANGFFELNGDFSGNDASFNIVDIKDLTVNETIKAATLMYGVKNVETEMDTKATTLYVDGQISGLINGAPGALDTLNELAAALNNDANYATTITNSLALKAPLANPKFTGNVGIGITSPVYPLDVESSTTVSIGNGYAYFRDHPTNGAELVNLGANYTFKVGIRSTNTIWALDFLTTSDKRIKTNIREVNDGLSLKMLRDLPCVYYDYIDKNLKGYDSTIGFIAQDVKEIMPMAVSSTQINVIPNEMRVLENVSWETITDISGDDKYKLTINDLSVNHVDISGNTKYRFYCSNEDLIEKQLEIENLENEPKSFIFEEQWQNVFLYGKVVDDFHTIDKNKIFAMAFSATQEIDKIQQQEKAKLATAEAKLATAEAKLATAEAKLATAEAKLEEQTLKLTNLIEQLKANNTIN